MNQDRGRRADAQRAGYDSLAWDEAVNAGRRWCHRCQAFEPVADFGRDGWRWDGLTTSCLRSRRRGRSLNADMIAWVDAHGGPGGVGA